MPPEKFALVVPVYNDWPAFGMLLADLGQTLPQTGAAWHVFVVNDGSDDDPQLPDRSLPVTTAITHIELIHLHCNLGHQRAIAIGLSEVARRNAFDAVVVMDADGEDHPQAVPQLVQALRQNPRSVIVARRTRRSEGIVFQSFYRLYKAIFLLLSGQTIDFGNFCVIPAHQLKRIIFRDTVWNHLAASLQRSRIPLVRIDVPRGPRYNGQSSMNLVALIIHGLSAITVYLDVVFVRISLMALVIALASIFGISAVIFIRLFTDLAIPGWATYTGGILLIILFQSLIFFGGAAFIVLSARSNPILIPALDTLRYIDFCEIVYEQTTSG